MTLRRLDTRDAGFDAALAALAQLPDAADAAIDSRVAAIVDDVRTRGDAALIELTARFDGVHVDSAAALEIGAAELDAALAAITPAQRAALDAAAARIRAFHERQLDACGRGFGYRDADGTWLGQKVTPIDRVGIYVPGGKAAYPSSVLMNALPARVAGVGEIVMVVPTPAVAGGSRAPGTGERNPLVLAAARLAGVDRVFAIGGAQAIAALAWGTATVPRVDKVTGPGNAYVAAAKRRVFGQVGIDMIAGPSEILVLADGSTPADWVAMDLFSQAEHDELAQSILLSPDAAYLDAVQAAIDRLLPEQPRRAVIRASLEGRGAFVLTRDMDEACAIANRIAPEHLEVSAREPRQWEPKLRHAGAIFLGAYASESLGDYCAGPNHVLPTAGSARFSSPLSVLDFQKRSSVIEVSAVGADALGRIAVELAHGEGLHAHAQAARLRLAAAPTSPMTVRSPWNSASAGWLAAPNSSRWSAPADAAFDVRRVDAVNLDAVLAIEVAGGQRQLVAGVAKALAQAAYDPASRALALYAGETPVGLLTLIDARNHAERPAAQLYVWRLLVDAAHQRRGYGRRAIEWVVAEARRLGMESVGLSHVDAPGHAGPFYERLGFAYTGVVDGVERKMRLDLRSPR